jgi:central kinetochore subunit Mis15/CHL4
VTHRDVVRTFSKLSRQSLISLAQTWLTKKNRDFCRPYLAGDENPDVEENEWDQEYTPAHSYEEIVEIYKSMNARKCSRKEAMDRILKGDWRTGISMYQLATAEIQHLLDHPTTLRWTAKRMTRISTSSRIATPGKDIDEDTSDLEHLPRFQAQTFMMNLARELTPVMKAHYLMTRIKTLPITILRVYIHDSPYSTEASLAADAGKRGSDSARAVFFIWPNGSPFVFVSLATNTGQVVGDEGRQLRDMVLHAIPKAFSRPSRRYQLTSTNFTTKSLSALLAYRGPGKSNAAAGGFSIFADHSFSQNALDFVTTGRSETQDKKEGDEVEIVGSTKRGPGRPRKAPDAFETPEASKRRKVAQGRFGSSAKADDGLGIERFEVRIDDPFPDMPANSAEPDGEEEAWVPEVRVAFHGSHVFAGVRELVEQGVVDGERMPGWMAGEAAVTIGTVRNGRIRTKGVAPGA